MFELCFLYIIFTLKPLFSTEFAAEKIKNKNCWEQVKQRTLIDPFIHSMF